MSLPLSEKASSGPAILGLCGSLRQDSSNRALLEVAASLVPAGSRLVIHEGLAEFPLFSADTEPSPLPAVLSFREAVAGADGIVIACPEYAHGIPGAFKNALDWVVASGEFSGKPVAVLNTSRASYHADVALIEVLATMDAKVVASASIRVPLPSSRITRAEIAANPELSELLKLALGQLIAAC